MAQDSPIEWTDKTWNPVRGCSRISTGCGGAKHQGGCYAEKIAARFSKPGQAFHGFAEPNEHGGHWTGKMALVPHALTVPFTWREPIKIFVNSMSDLFHENLPMRDIAEVFGVMAVAGHKFLSGRKSMICGFTLQNGDESTKRPIKSFGEEYGPHTFQVLTKRSDRLRQILSLPAFREAVAGAAHRHAHNRVAAGVLSDAIMDGSRWPLPNVWLGVSVEDQDAADHRIPDLLATPTAVRFLSCEPLLGPVRVDDIVGPGGTVLKPLVGLTWRPSPEGMRLVGGSGPRINWVIAGGESGPRKRPVDAAWLYSLRDQCVAAGTPFFAKQLDKVQPLPADLMIRQFPEAA